ncbi:glutathione S-transferase [Maricaulis sp.]|jgi:YHS domain-containing protein|uniref:glutathione S-transferase n=1 Tax=Maricaulis sp. TaxID=1486257 RepID=UPI000C3FCABB|nr:glutathione S-transferase [Maricaulis sp.]
MKLAMEDVINETCPWSGQPVSAIALTRYRGEVVGFCNPECRDKFESAVRHFDARLAEAGANPASPNRP